MKFGASPANVRATGLPGIYEVTESTEVLYVSADGKYMLVGDLFDLATKGNLTEARRKDIRRGLLAGVKDDEVITFAPAVPKYELYVFTDVDCGFCRRLHAQMPELNSLGIRVRYLFFPRAGMGTEGARKAEAVWCSTNRQAALSQAKTGAEVATRRCKNPVEAEYKLGQAIGLQGTPALYTPAGDEIRNGEPQDILRQLVEAGR
jgi:thiol:disulfide interchange protein DsbC